MSSRLRISGLVRIANRVRREISSPLPLPRLQSLKSHVERQLQQVEAILAEAHVQELALPDPSRRALRFLREVNWDRLPAAEAQGAPPATESKRLVWPGLTAFVDRALRHLAEADTPDQFEAIRNLLERQNGQIEFAIRRHEGRAVHVGNAIQAAIAWIAFFAQQENMQLYAKARRLAAPILARVVRQNLRHLPMRLHFRPLNGIFRFRPSATELTISLPTPMIAFDSAAFESLARLMFTRDRSQREAVIAAMSSDEYQTIRAELESLGGLAEQARGAYHDLAGSFDRVNASLFNGTMARPHLTWSRSFTGRKFGHYDSIRDTVMVSSSLDRADVPEFVVDYLMYHELLHKKHGARWTNGRRYSHFTDFYAEERRFPRYDEADTKLKRIAEGL